MKKLLYLATVVALISTWTGCSRGWPSCFCRNQEQEYAVADTCEYQAACGCDGYSSAPGVEYVRPSVPTPTPETGLPGPATSSSSAR